MLRNLLLGTASFRPLYAPDTGTGAGGGTAAADTGAAADGAGKGDTAAAAASAGAAAAAAAGAAADAGGKKQESLASGAAAGDKVSTPDWPADWREKLAGEDKAFLKTLQRYASPLAVGEWLRKNQLKIAAGELKEVKPAPGKDAKPEELAAWRKEQGLPEKPEAYVGALKLPDGTVLGDEDKPLVESFAERALAQGMPQQTFDALVSWWYETQDQLAAQRQELDQDQRIAAEQRLLQEMGADFKPNMNALKSFWSTAPDGMAAAVLQARAPDGRLVGDIPEVVAFFAGLSRELNPAATLLPAGSGTDLKSVQGRIAEIEGLMYKDSPAGSGKWGPLYTPELQREYRELIDAQQKLATRAA